MSTPTRRYPAHVFLALTLLVGACSLDHVAAEADRVGDVPIADLEPHEAMTLRLLKLRTPDGSGETVHPDFAQAPMWANPMLLVATPYPGGNTGLENPTLFARGKGFEWSPVSERANPLAKPTAGHLSDPDMVAIPNTSELWIYYRQTDSKDRIFVVRTNDGEQFTAPVQIATAGSYAIVSPAIVRRDSTHWRMWSVNANAGGCRAASTTVEMRRSLNGKRWFRPKTVALGRPGSSVWHLDVQWIPSRHEYWALYNAKVAGSCATTALFLATSPDGVTWYTYPKPVIKAGVIPEFQDVVYRSTFAYDPVSDAVRLWYSGARVDDDGYFAWQSAFDRRSRTELFESISGVGFTGVIPSGPRANAARFDPP